MYNQMSPTFAAADALLRDYERKSPFWYDDPRCFLLFFERFLRQVPLGHHSDRISVHCVFPRRSNDSIRLASSRRAALNSSPSSADPKSDADFFPE